MNYYYIMIEKVNKTLELLKYNSCLATTFEKWKKSKGIENIHNLLYLLKRHNIMHIKFGLQGITDGIGGSAPWGCHIKYAVLAFFYHKTVAFLHTAIVIFIRDINYNIGIFKNTVKFGYILFMPVYKMILTGQGKNKLYIGI